MRNIDYRFIEKGENEDGSISVEIVKKNLNQICEVMGLDSITSIVLDPTYEVLTMTYVEGGTSKTTTLRPPSASNTTTQHRALPDQYTTP